MAAAGLGTRAAEEEAGTDEEAVEAVSYLLSLGANIDAVADTGDTAMHGAAFANFPKVVKLLAARGAKIAVWNRKNKRGWTPLLIAEGHRYGNFKPSFETIAAIKEVMRAAGVAPLPRRHPPPPPARPSRTRRRRCVQVRAKMDDLRGVAPEGCQGQNLRVLVADDEPISRLLLSRALGRWGYQVEVATDGAQAWEILQQPGAPSLAVMAWILPGVDGPAICRRLRARDACSQGYTYVLLLTSRAESQDVVDGLESGADDYLVKPVELPQLRARLRVGRRILDLEGRLRAEGARYENLAMHDALTGIWNRGALVDAVGRELQRGRREQRCVGAIMLDIDRFKQVNDTHGHAVGDEVIVETARRLRATIRAYDGLGRLGGEEFLALVSCRNQDEAIGLAERVRLAIAASPFQTAAGPVDVTASVGVATSEAVGFDRATIMAAADKALYLAKHNGRNRVEAQRDPPAARSGSDLRA